MGSCHMPPKFCVYSVLTKWHLVGQAELRSRLARLHINPRTTNCGIRIDLIRPAYAAVFLDS